MSGETSGSRSGVVKIVIAVALIAAFAGGFASFIKKKSSELPVYTKAGARMLDGENIYRKDENKPFTYPPFFALPFVPFADLSENVRRGVWYVVNVGVLLAICWILWRIIRPYTAATGPRGPPRWVFVVFVLLLAGRHVSSVFVNHSHDLIVMLAVTIAVTAAARARAGFFGEFGAGLGAGVGAACKATPLLFAPVFVWQRRFVAALAAIGIAVGLTLLPDIVFPQGNGERWVESWFNVFVGKIRPGEPLEVEGAWSSWNLLNQNLEGTLYRLSTPVPNVDRHHFDVSLWHPSRDVLKYVTWIAKGCVLLFVIFVTRPGLARGATREELAFRRLAEGGVVVCAMVLLSPMSSKSHFCILVIPIMACVADFLYRKRDPIVGALLLLVFLAGTLTVKGIWGSRMGNEFLARGCVTLTALACLLATGHVLFHRRVKGGAPDVG